MWTEATWPGFRPLWKKNIFTLQCISSLLLATPWSSYVNLIHLILSSWHTPTPRKKRCECKKILNLHSDHVNSIQLVAWDRFKLAIPPAKQLVWSPWCHSPGWTFLRFQGIAKWRKAWQWHLWPSNQRSCLDCLTGWRFMSSKSCMDGIGTNMNEIWFFYYYFYYNLFL